MAVDRTDQLEREQALANKHKPLLVLYPEISSDTRTVRQEWKETHRPPLGARLPPLAQDYHPRDVRLVLDHSRIPSWKIPSGTPTHRGDALVKEMQENATDRIDILAGIRADERGKFWSEYNRIVHNEGAHDHGTYPYQTYVHIVDGGELADATPENESLSVYRGFIAIEYWLFYIYNDWKVPHEGDWELIVVLLKKPSENGGQLQPIGCGYSAHHGGYRLPWPQVEKVDEEKRTTDDGNHPVVYVANGSHANYFHGPARFVTSTEVFGREVAGEGFPFVGDFVDFTTSIETGKTVFPDAKVVPPPVGDRWTDDSWRWLNFSGKWGSPGVPKSLKWLPNRFRIGPLKIWGAPGSLPKRRNWIDPFTWADHECQDAPPPDSWLARQ